jgi:two-component system phosphate regulon response regulator OmpR
MSRKILVVDDEKKIHGMITDYLESLGYHTSTASDGKEALERFHRDEPDLVILDIMMPGIDGIDVTRRIRSESNVPIILLTAKSRESDKLIGLDTGADDYITKPFSLKELEARIRTVLRRTSASGPVTEQTEPVTYRDIELDPEKMSVRRRGKPVDLTTAQFKILETLVRNPGRVFSRMDLLKSFQETAFEGYERTIDVHIKNIRKALEPDPARPVYIVTVWGAGYKFAEEEIEE